MTAWIFRQDNDICCLTITASRLKMYVTRRSLPTCSLKVYNRNHVDTNKTRVYQFYIVLNHTRKNTHQYFDKDVMAIKQLYFNLWCNLQAQCIQYQLDVTLFNQFNSHHITDTNLYFRVNKHDNILRMSKTYCLSISIFVQTVFFKKQTL